MRGPKQGCVRELPPSHSARISRVFFAVARRFPHYSHERQIRRTKALSAANYRAGDAGSRFSRMAVSVLPGNMSRNARMEVSCSRKTKSCVHSNASFTGRDPQCRTKLGIVLLSWEE